VNNLMSLMIPPCMVILLFSECSQAVPLTFETSVASNITQTSSILNGATNNNNPNDAGAILFPSIVFGTTSPPTSSVTPSPNTIPYGDTANFSYSATGLECGKKYYFYAAWEDSNGRSGKGSELSFITTPCRSPGVGAAYQHCHILHTC
jgi:hypothetical protein